MNINEMIGTGLTEYTKFIQNRNAMMDGLFYDVDSLSKEEKERLKNEVNPEGSIIIISPKQCNKKYEFYSNAEKFIKSKHKNISKFVVAGVGSSNLGGASLARNVAYFFNQEAGAIVAGYGVTDLMSEAWGGWFSLGAANRFASFFEEINKSFTPKASIASDADINQYVAGHPDSRTLLQLLLSENVMIDFILGHSKGCLSIANSLNGFVSLSTKERVQKCVDDIQILTTGAITELPDAFYEKSTQVIGDIDWFGGMNSRINLDYKTIPLA